MKIGVISDTHIPLRTSVLPEIIDRSFSEVDHIIHAGDIADIRVIRKLEEFAPVTAVAGNIDPPGLRELFGEKKLVALGGFMFGIVHGHGSKSKTIDRAAKAFSGIDLDCIIFGHSHIPFCGYRGNMLFFNPGSPTDKRRNKHYSFGILETNETVSPRIIYFNAAGEIVYSFHV
jgi:putative phosphoesterase